MNSTILQVNASPGKPLLPNGLTEILWIIEPQSGSLYFSIFDLEGELREKPTIPYYKLQEKIGRSNHGLSVNWGELTTLCQELVDVYDLLLVGYSKSDLPPIKASFEELSKDIDAVIEISDSAYLRFSYANEQLIQRTKDVFPQATIFLNGDGPGEITE